MPDGNELIGLGLSARQKEFIPSPEELQFEKAVPIGSPGSQGSVAKLCVACKRGITSEYFHAQGQVVCPSCAALINAGQQGPPHTSLARAALYGAGAALAGSAAYALVTIVTGYQIGLIAIFVGILVGKAIRRGSHGLGGRPQQILAVALTYFAITSSYIPVALYHFANRPKPAVQASATTAAPATASIQQPAPNRMSFGAAIGLLLIMALGAPFLSLSSGFSGLLTLAIIFFGLLQAWKLTGRSELLIAGPYSANDVSRL